MLAINTLKHPGEIHVVVCNKDTRNIWTETFLNVDGTSTSLLCGDQLRPR